MNILVLEFITTVGGVQSVYKNILPHLSKKYNILFLDPYQNKFDMEISKIDNIEVVNLPIKSNAALGWKGGMKNKIKILFKFGIVYLNYLFKLLKFIKKRQINLIYVSGKKEIVFAFLLSKLTGIKYVYHSHGFASYKDISILYRTCMNNASSIIAVSRCVKNILIQAKVNKQKIEVVYNGLNLDNVPEINKELFKIKEKDDEFKIIFIGAIQPQKGIDVLIDSVNILLEKGRKIKLIILGEVTNNIYDNYYKKLQETSCCVNKLQIQFLGFQDNVYVYLNDADILILPSREESFGMVLLEAMNMSLPVVGSNVGGIPEVIDDGTTGFIFKVDDKQDLADKIDTLLKNYDLRIKMGIEGKQKLNKMFTAEIQSIKIAHIIRNTRKYKRKNIHEN